MKNNVKRETAIKAIARVAVVRTNNGKHGPLFGEVSIGAGLEVVEHFLAEVLDRVLNKGERVWLVGFGTFHIASRAPTTKRDERTHRLAFSPSDAHRGLPKKTKGGAA